MTFHFYEEHSFGQKIRKLEYSHYQQRLDTVFSIKRINFFSFNQMKIQHSMLLSWIQMIAFILLKKKFQDVIKILQNIILSLTNDSITESNMHALMIKVYDCVMPITAQRIMPTRGYCIYTQLGYLQFLYLEYHS